MRVQKHSKVFSKSTERRILAYIVENYPATPMLQIAQNLGWSSVAPVRKRLIKSGRQILTRGHGHITKRTSVITQVQHEILEGWLLSDAHLRSASGDTVPTFHLSLVNKKEAILYTQRNLPFSFRFGCKPASQSGERNNKAQDVISSHCDRALIPYYIRWYGKWKKKRLPKDFILTPRTIRFAVYGDGCRNRNNMVLCLQGLPLRDLKRLVLLFQEIGFHFTIDKKRTLVLTGDPTFFRHRGNGALAMKQFLEWLGKPELACFQYKFVPVSTFIQSNAD